MTWYYVDAGQQAGPVDDAQLTELARSGKIQHDTLVWHEGMAGWTAYWIAFRDQPRQEPEIASPPNPTPAAAEGLICCECGRSFAPDQVIRYGEKWVCATCKPIFLQRLREGAALAHAGPTTIVTEAELLARDYQVDIHGCLLQGWELFKNNAGIMIGVTVLVYLAVFAASAVAALVRKAVHVPFLNFAVILLTAPMMGGLWLFYIKKVRGQEAELSDAFAGFGPRYWQLVLTALIPSVISLGFVTLIGLVAGGSVMATILGSRGGGSATALAPALLIPVGIAAIVAGMAMIYLGVCWKFALPLAADKGLKFWPALELSRRVVSKHWWMTFWMIVLSSVMTFFGFLFCLVGALITGPTGFAMLNCHYQKVFGDLAPNQTQ